MLHKTFNPCGNQCAWRSTKIYSNLRQKPKDSVSCYREICLFMFPIVHSRWKDNEFRQNKAHIEVCVIILSERWWQFLKITFNEKIFFIQSILSDTFLPPTLPDIMTYSSIQMNTTCFSLLLEYRGLKCQ